MHSNLLKVQNDVRLPVFMMKSLQLIQVFPTYFQKRPCLSILCRYIYIFLLSKLERCFIASVLGNALLKYINLFVIIATIIYLSYITDLFISKHALDLMLKHFFISYFIITCLFSTHGYVFIFSVNGQSIYKIIRHLSVKIAIKRER